MSQGTVHYLLNKAWHYRQNRGCITFLEMARHNVFVQGKSGAIGPVAGMLLKLALIILEWLLKGYFVFAGMVKSRRFS